MIENVLNDFNLDIKELQLAYTKSNNYKIGFIVLYKYLQIYGKFPI